MCSMCSSSCIIDPVSFVFVYSSCYMSVVPAKIYDFVPVPCSVIFNLVHLSATFTIFLFISCCTVFNVLIVSPFLKTILSISTYCITFNHELVPLQYTFSDPLYHLTVYKIPRFWCGGGGLPPE